MVDHKQIQKTMTAIESQRAALGDSITNTTLAALQDLRQRPAARPLEMPLSRNAQRKQITVIFAKVTGFGAMTGGMQETAVLNLINALWRRLDNAITQQGGIIDKHLGDAIMGLFGVPIAHEDDPEQAIRAALQMRATLSDFVAELKSSLDQETLGQLPDLQTLRLSVGINTGPVMLGRVGDSEEYTVIGDTVNVASRLERAAPPGGILISHDTYLLVRDKFNVEPLGPVPIKGRTESIQVYLTIGVKPRIFYGMGRGVEGVETRMIGRDTEMAGLKAALQLAIGSRSGRAITIVGEAGLGKSRLTHEFTTWAKSLPQELQELKGRSYQHMRQIPYGLFRTMLAAFFGIQDSDPASIARQKLIQGIGQYQPGETEEVRQRAFTIAQLLGLDLGLTAVAEAIPTAPTETDEDAAPHLRDLAYQYIRELLQSMTAVTPATLLFLEDLHWADEGSLELLEYLLPICRQTPLLLIMLTRPVDISLDSDQPLARHGKLLGQPGGAQVISLQSLSESQSRELVLEILRKAPEIPGDLSDLIVSRAEGNPLFVEEMIKILIEDGVIIAGQDEWQVRRNQILSARVPPHLNGVLQARLDRLSELERATLQRAAVVGRIFWDSAVIHMNETAVPATIPSETLVALQALEKREMIFKRQVSGFAGTQAYVFKHAILHQVAYESVLLRFRPGYHKQAGDWLAEQSGDRVAENAGLIAEHYEMAGERTAAAELYEMAAQRAQHAFDPELAIDYYRKALALLADQSHYAEWLLRLQEELGKLLQMRARFVEASQVFMTMRSTAEEDGDLAAQARAWNGLAAIQHDQGNYKTMLNSARQAEQVSWLIGAEMELIRSLLGQGEAYLHMGDLPQALATIERALHLSDRQEEIVARTKSLYLLCLTHVRDGRYDDAYQGIYQLQQQLSLLITLDELHAAAATHYALGNLQNQLGQYDEAATSLLAALKLFRNLDVQIETGWALYRLGETARQRGNFHAAVPFYRKALSVANGIGYRYGRLEADADMGRVLVNLGNYDLAEEILQNVRQIAENEGLMAGWRRLPELYAFLALNQLGKSQTEEAVELARQAHELAQQLGDAEVIGLTWRILGRALAALPLNKQWIQLGDGRFDAAACFAQSLRLFEMLNGGGTASHRDQALTLWQWALFERANGQPELGERLQKRAEALAQPLNLALV
ncbi:MAG TPA: adenylate/guanylate cyclase domain-containing protein [Chloroflexota bacterium]|nr:adenylate/guanylate cyclase domain-containing protein [Chloroflexota bacterium]